MSPILRAVMAIANTPVITARREQWRSQRHTRAALAAMRTRPGGPNTISGPCGLCRVRSRAEISGSRGAFIMEPGKLMASLERALERCAR